MSAAQALLAFGLPLFAGAAALAALGLRPRSDPLAWLGWTWAAGAFLTGLVTFAWAWTGPDTADPTVPRIALAVLALALVALARRRRTPAPLLAGEGPGPWRLAPRLERLFFAASLAFCALATAGRVALGTLRPVLEDDEANFWALKAKLLFTHEGFGQAFLEAAQPPRLYNADYPFLNPSLQLWTFSNAGEVLHVANRVPIQLFAVALVLVLAAALRRVVRPAAAALLVATVAGLFEFGSQSARGHGDLMVALGAVIAGDAWLRWRAAPAPAWGRLAAFGLAFLAWSKNEGQLFLAALLVAALAAALAGRRPPCGALRSGAFWRWAVLPLGVLALNHAVNAWHGWVSGFLGGAEREATILGLLREQFPGRIGPVLAFLGNEVALERSASGGLLLLLAGLWLFFPRRLARGPLLVPALALALVYAGYVLVFVGAPHDLAWHLRTAARRVCFQPLPLVALLVGAAAGEVLPALRPARQREIENEPRKRSSASSGSAPARPV